MRFDNAISKNIYFDRSINQEKHLNTYVYEVIVHNGVNVPSGWINRTKSPAIIQHKKQERRSKTK